MGWNFIKACKKKSQPLVMNIFIEISQNNLHVKQPVPMLLIVIRLPFHFMYNSKLILKSFGREICSYNEVVHILGKTEK